MQSLELNLENAKAMFDLNIPHNEPVLNPRAEARRAKIKEEAGRFRVLIIGRANAGKTTILKTICDTTEEPEIYTSEGQKVSKLHNRALYILN